MRTVFIKKRFSQDPKTIYNLMTKQEHVAHWWGPENVTLGDHSLNLGRIGPWSSHMVDDDGKTHRAYGEVLQVKLMQSSKMSFKWQDDEIETFLTLEIVPRDDGETELLLTHEGFKTEESEQIHQDGWSSAMRKLSKYIGSLS